MAYGNHQEKKISESQYLQDKIKKIEIHWDVVKKINGGDGGIRTLDRATNPILP